MSQRVASLNCPGCGAIVSLGDKNCKYCGNPITLESFSDVRSGILNGANDFLENYRAAAENTLENEQVQASLGIVLYDQGDFVGAVEALSKTCITSAESEHFFYLALAKFRKQPSFAIKTPEAKEILQLLNKAIILRELAHYFWAKGELIKILFEQRYIKYTESSVQMYQKAESLGLSELDISKTKQVLYGTA